MQIESTNITWNSTGSVDMTDYCSKKLSKTLYDKQLRDWSSKSFYLTKEGDEGLYDLNQHKSLVTTSGSWFPAYRLSTVLDYFRNELQINIYSYANWEEGTWSTVVQRASDSAFQGESTELILGHAHNPRTWKEAIERGILSVAENVETFRKVCTESDY